MCDEDRLDASAKVNDRQWRSNEQSRHSEGTEQRMVGTQRDGERMFSIRDKPLCDAVNSASTCFPSLG